MNTSIVNSKLQNDENYVDNKFHVGLEYALLRDVNQGIEYDTLKEMFYSWLFGNWNDVLSADVEKINTFGILNKIELLIGSSYFQLGDISAAKSHLKRAEELGCHPELVKEVMLSGLYSTLGVVSELSGEHQQAVDYAQTSLNILGLTDKEQYISEIRVKKSNHIITNVTDNDQGQSARFSIDKETLKLLNFDLLNIELFNKIRAYVYSGNTEDIAEAAKLLSNIAVTITHSCQEIPFLVDEVSINGKEYYLTHVVGDYIPEKVKKSKNFYEISFLEFIRQFYTSGDYIIDVGANIGNHTIYFAAELGAKVLSFEPQPHNIICLESNVYLNNLSEQVTVNRFGLGAESGYVDIAMYRDMNYGTFSAKSDHFELPLEKFTLEVKCLDDIIEPQQKVSIIKIDVEGMEYEVLLGASKLIQKHKPLVTTECLNVDEFLKIEQYLAEYDYVMIDVLNLDPSFVFICLSNELHRKIYFDIIRYTKLKKIDWFDNKKTVVYCFNYQISNLPNRPYLPLSKTPYYINIDVKAGHKLSIVLNTSYINICDGVNNKALLTVRFWDENNQDVTGNFDNYKLTFSEHLNLFYVYIPNTYETNKEVVNLDVPPVAERLTLGIQAFGLDNQELVLIYNDIMVTAYI